MPMACAGLTALIALAGAGAAAADASLALPARVHDAGGLDAWNDQPDVRVVKAQVERLCQATTVADALAEVRAVLALGHPIWAYAYMRALYNRDMELYYAALLAAPEDLLPVVYTPTVGEACQKFGVLPAYPRGCYVSLDHRGRVEEVLRAYAEAHYARRADGTYDVEAVVFTDGGRILGLGDLGAWGMGIPIGKLDLYTVCAGVDPRKTLPVLLDVGVGEAADNAARIDVRGHPLYTGRREPRARVQGAGGALVNECYFDETALVEEFMGAAVKVFGPKVLLQFEDFNSNDALPLLQATKERFLTYNDDIQGTAAVTVAGILGGLRIREPDAGDLAGRLKDQVFLFHGAGSANIGAARLLRDVAGVDPSRLILTNSRGVIWRAADGGEGGNFRSDEQKDLAQVGEPAYPHEKLVDIVKHARPTVLVGAVGRAPGCFDQQVIEGMNEVAPSDPSDPLHRPIVFALSNPRTQAECTAAEAYGWSQGRAIFGSGTAFPPFEHEGVTRVPGQVNNVYVFPGLSFGVVACDASTIPEALFLAAAEAVAKEITPEELREDRVVPPVARIRDVGLSVAVAVVRKSQELGIAGTPLGDTEEEVRKALEARMWKPSAAPAA